ncbi:1-phosphofructokinase [Acidaminobacter sp. JC074]|uniref:1-phosphofructokinase n=1 Tax=Acidaminobacter sp. JC074 TaxID=2530199 RepID=UPI001F106C63|nr:1-phosphofructokinase [Acidaminobacter sp. JC074]MCH4889528.1 1-phosphofructokinase [Acidaminobacter sp. JC074]
MIITLTMNPAIDKTVEVDYFEVDKVNRITDIHLDAAGKGINVSKVVKALGGRTKTLAFLGGDTGDFIQKSLEEDHLSFVKVPVQGKTRTNTKIVDFKNKTFTDLNEPGAYVDQNAQDIFMNHLLKLSSSQSMVVCTGSVPPGIDKSIYKEIIMRLQSFGAKTLLDASGDLFAEGLLASPTIVKPNIHELEMYVGKKLTSDEMLVEACLSFIEMGVEIAVVSLGEKGALMVTRDKILKAQGLKVDVKSTVGAGDAMVAAICYGYEKNFPLNEILSLAVASSAAQVSVKGTQVPNLDLIYKLRKHVEIIEL